MLNLDFHPTGRHFLQIPGPSPVPDRILRAMSLPTIDHRGPEFGALGRKVLADIQKIFKTQHPVMIYPASGTGAWEAALVNTLSPGDSVTTEGVITAVGDYGFWMQDPTVASGANAGIRVELGSAPTVALHHRVRVSGTIDDYFGELQLSAGGATDLGATTPVAPIGKWLADATTEAFEGTLTDLYLPRKPGRPGHS